MELPSSVTAVAHEVNPETTEKVEIILRTQKGSALKINIKLFLRLQNYSLKP